MDSEDINLLRRLTSPQTFSWLPTKFRGRMATIAERFGDKDAPLGFGLEVHTTAPPDVKVARAKDVKIKIAITNVKVRDVDGILECLYFSPVLSLSDVSLADVARYHALMDERIPNLTKYSSFDAVVVAVGAKKSREKRLKDIDSIV